MERSQFHPTKRHSRKKKYLPGGWAHSTGMNTICAICHHSLGEHFGDNSCPTEEEVKESDGYQKKDL